MKKKIIYAVIILLAVYGGLRIAGSFFGMSVLQTGHERSVAEFPEIQAGAPAGVRLPSFGSVVGNQEMAQKSYQGDVVLPPEQPAPVANDEVEERLVIRNGTIRAVVEDVKAARDVISQRVNAAGGFVVNSTLTEPETAPHLSMSVRVPAERLDEIMGLVRERAERVTYETVSADDVTDQYVDEQARLTSLQETRAQMSKIMEQAQEISDLLNIQRQMQQVDQQIEQTKGRMEYLQKSAKLSLLNIELAQSEFELSVTPTEKWRPGFVFKQSVRNLLAFLQDLSYTVIKLAVYAVIWIPGLIIGLFVYRRLRK